MDDWAVRFWRSRFDHWQAELETLPRRAWIRRRRLERRIDRVRAYVVAFPAQAWAVAEVNR